MDPHFPNSFVYLWNVIVWQKLNRKERERERASVRREVKYLGKKRVTKPAIKQ